MTKLDTMKTCKTYMFERMGFETTDGKNEFCIGVERMNKDGSSLIVKVPDKMLSLTKTGYMMHLNDMYSIWLKSWQLNQTDNGYEVLLTLDLFEPFITNSGFKSRTSKWHDLTNWMEWLDIAYLQSVETAQWDVML